MDIDDNIILKTKQESKLISDAEISLSSYMTKEEFINFINIIDFKSIKYCDMKLITGFILDTEENNFKMVTKDIEIR